ncbi:antibiotic biosynthesis monooxygenase [Conexibacter stalactiti]|uniref:Antibiotic biosynthesis monooxygenase n=1 Tax=Conexibacter stalactiti TaxID=1940611 RepID=A0ABU4HKJ0_9ACTN|nr:antibiotic biosynthesis monooxygenase [Conexibacter stalactiti]MDW5593836.1 antibiotic biosynthesis monooxygenase [Conexibacter stalactiti]MEC5034478.1 antibiotic biosynthesis monooxygenase [Conexibacter stalactiti]
MTPAADTGFYSFIDYTVDGPQTQRELIEAFAEIQEQRVRSHPGYRSARFFASTDGTRVYNVVSWASEADYLRFDETDDREQRQAAIQRALDGLSGHAEPRMTGAPRYRLLREVGPLPPAGAR